MSCFAPHRQTDREFWLEQLERGEECPDRRYNCHNRDIRCRFRNGGRRIRHDGLSFKGVLPARSQRTTRVWMPAGTVLRYAWAEASSSNASFLWSFHDKVTGSRACTLKYGNFRIF